MNKIIKSSLAVVLLTGVGITSTSAKEISYSDVATISEDPVYVLGSSAFVNKITVNDIIQAPLYDVLNGRDFDGNFYLKIGNNWTHADSEKALSADELKKTIDITRIIGEKTGNYISTNAEIYSNIEKYGYTSIQKPYDIDNTRFAEYFISATEANRTAVNSDDMVNAVFKELNNSFKDALYVKAIDEASGKYVTEDGLIEIHITSDTTKGNLTSALNIVRTFLAQEYLDSITLVYSEANYSLDGSNVTEAVDEMLTAMGAKNSLSTLDNEEFDIIYNFNEQAKNKDGKGTYKVKFVVDIVYVPTNEIVENVAQSVLPDTYTDAVDVDENGNVTIYLDEEIEIEDADLLTALNDVFTKNPVISAINVDGIKIERDKVSDVVEQLKAISHNAGDSVKITFEFDGLAQPASDNSAEITFNFKKSVNTDELFTKYSKPCEAEQECPRDDVLAVDYENETGTLTLTIKDGPELKVPSNTGVVTAITNALNGNYDKVTITYGVDKAPIEITKDDISSNGVYLKVAQLAAGLLEAALPIQVSEIAEKLKDVDFGDLAGKSFTMEFVTDSNKVDEKGTHDQYTVYFKTELEIDKYVNQVVSAVNTNKETFGFNAILDSETKELLFNINDDTKHLNDIHGSNIFSAMWLLANNNRVESVTLKIGTESIVLDKNSIKLTDTNKMLERVLGALNIRKEDLSTTLLSAIKADISVTVKLIGENDDITLASSDTDSTKVVKYTLRIGKFYDSLDTMQTLATQFNSSAVSKSNYRLDYNKNDRKVILHVTPRYTSKSNLYNPGQLATDIAAQLNTMKSNHLVDKLVLKGNVDHEYSDASSIRSLLYDIAELDKNGLATTTGNLTPSNLNGKSFTLTINLSDDDTVEFKDANSNVFTFEIVVDKININDLLIGNLKMKDDDVDTNSYIGENYFTPSYNAESKTVTLALKNVNTPISEVKGTNVFNLINKYAGLLEVTYKEEVTENGEVTYIDKALTAQNLSELIKTKTSKELTEVTLEDLANSFKDGIQITFSGEYAVEPVTITVKFDTGAAIVENFDPQTSSLQTLIDGTTEKVYLDKSFATGLNFTKANKTFEIVGNGQNLTGDIKISAANVNLKLTNVNVTGNIEVTGDNATITGSADYDEEGKVTKWNTVVTGGIKANTSSKNITIDQIEIVGTKNGLTETGSKKAVIDATSAETVTLTDSNVSYSGDGEEQIYSLLHVNGKSVKITGNTFDVSKAKNPIEFKWAGTEIESATISDNKFTGDNYVDDSHNIINVYKLAANATVDILNNDFEYANSVLRISNPDNHNVVFNVADNHVEKYSDNDKGTKSLIVIRPNTKMHLNTITIKQASNTFGPENKLYTKDSNDDETLLIWTNDKNHQSPEGEVIIDNYEAPTE